MESRYTRKNQNIKRKWTTIAFQLFVVGYLLFFIVAQLASPTAAGFSDSEQVQGTIHVADDWGKDQKQTSENQQERQDSGTANQHETSRSDSHSEQKVVYQTGQKNDAAKGNGPTSAKVNTSHKRTKATESETIKVPRPRFKNGK